ncbi:MAG: hypothetical protein NVS3B26_20250 [Mycobacteriales bacterium]
MIRGQQNTQWDDENFYQQLQVAAALSAAVVVPLVMQWLAARRVVDVGSARVTWLAALRSAGVGRILGLDRRFNEQGFTAHECLRPVLWADERVSWRYRQNTIIYISRHARSASAAFHREQRWPGEPPLRLVQSHRYLEWAQYAVAEAAARWDKG